MRVSECKFYDSKMRPLLLVYDNPDTLSVLKDVRIMFKHGDGTYVFYFMNVWKQINMLYVIVAWRSSVSVRFI